MKKKPFSHVLVSHITRFFSVFCRGVLHEHVDLGFTQNKYKLKLNIFSYQTKVHIHNYFPLVGPFGTSNDRLQNWTETWKNPSSLTTAPDMMSKSKIDRIISTHCHCCQSWFWKLEEFFLCEIKNNNSCLILGGGMLL